MTNISLTGVSATGAVGSVLPSNPNTLFAGMTRETLLGDTPAVNIASAVRETLYGVPSQANLAGMARETLLIDNTLRMAGIVRETLRTNDFPTLTIGGFEAIQYTRQTQPIVYMRYSDDGGQTWSNPIGQTLGNTGLYKTDIQWRRVGMSRNRVFEFYFDNQSLTAINGIFVDFDISET